MSPATATLSKNQILQTVQSSRFNKQNPIKTESTWKSELDDKAQGKSPVVKEEPEIKTPILIDFSNQVEQLE